MLFDSYSFQYARFNCYGRKPAPSDFFERLLDDLWDRNQSAGQTGGGTSAQQDMVRVPGIVGRYSKDAEAIMFQAGMRFPSRRKCKTGKVRYRVHKGAVRALHRIEGARQRALDAGLKTRRYECRAYECRMCIGWHLTSQDHPTTLQHDSFPSDLDLLLAGEDAGLEALTMRRTRRTEGPHECGTNFEPHVSMGPIPS